MAQPAKKYVESLNTTPLLLVMEQLTDEYRKTRNLMGDQISALVRNDLDQLNKITEMQVQRYEVLQKLEHSFRIELNKIFDDCDTPEKGRSLSSFMADLDKPNENLNNLRDKLKEQVELTQKYKDQLMNLLEFAREHNAGILKEVYTEGDVTSAHYTNEGRRTTNLRSVMINRKA
jgi:DNA repair ATPase RecN